MKVTINNIEYPVAFGMAAFRDLKKRTGMDLPDITKQFGTALAQKGNAVGIDDLEKIGELIISGIRNGSRKAKQDIPSIDMDDVFDAFDDPNFMSEVMEELTSSMPDTPPNQKRPAKKLSKKR